MPPPATGTPSVWVSAGVVGVVVAVVVPPPTSAMPVVPITPNVIATSRAVAVPTIRLRNVAALT
jgi:hypothetical protein